MNLWKFLDFSSTFDFHKSLIDTIKNLGGTIIKTTRDSMGKKNLETANRIAKENTFHGDYHGEFDRDIQDLYNNTTQVNDLTLTNGIGDPIFENCSFTLQGSPIVVQIRDYTFIIMGYFIDSVVKKVKILCVNPWFDSHPISYKDDISNIMLMDGKKASKGYYIPVNGNYEKEFLYYVYKPAYTDDSFYDWESVLDNFSIKLDPSKASRKLYGALIPKVIEDWMKDQQTEFPNEVLMTLGSRDKRFLNTYLYESSTGHNTFVSITQNFINNKLKKPMKLIVLAVENQYDNDLHWKDVGYWVLMNNKIYRICQSDNWAFKKPIYTDLNAFVRDIKKADDDYDEYLRKGRQLEADAIESTRAPWSMVFGYPGIDIRKLPKYNKSNQSFTGDFYLLPTATWKPIYEVNGYGFLLDMTFWGNLIQTSKNYEWIQDFSATIYKVKLKDENKMYMLLSNPKTNLKHSDFDADHLDYVLDKAKVGNREFILEKDKSDSTNFEDVVLLFMSDKLIKDLEKKGYKLLTDNFESDDGGIYMR